MNFKSKKKKFNRYTGLVVVMCAVFALIISKMVELQFIKGEEYAERANSQSTKNITQQAPRGPIIDSKGNVLATSVLSYNLVYVDTTEARKEIYRTIDKVNALLEKSGEEISDAFELKLDPYRFEFNAETPDGWRRLELRWKKDRGIDAVVFDTIMKAETGKMKIADLNEAETDRLNDLIIAYSAEDTYFYLLERYKTYEALELDSAGNKEMAGKTGQEIEAALLEKFTRDTIRDYIIIKDSITMQNYQGSKSVTIVNNMKADSAFTFMQQLSFLPGIDVKSSPIRIYPYGELAAHVLGYLSPINPLQKDRYEEKGYDISSDYIGASGIEAAYEDRLKGSKEESTVKVDTKGRPLSELFLLEAVLGNTVQLSLDLDLQNVAEQGLKEISEKLTTTNRIHTIGGYLSDSSNANRGAVVAIEVKTGRVLSLASFPSFDPNIFAVPGRLTSDLYTQYFNPDYEAYGKELVEKMKLPLTVDELFPLNADGTRRDPFDIYPRPFFNYATQGLTSPGSTFKPVTAVAALEEGALTASTVINDGGVYSNPGLKGYRVTNDGGKGYGSMTVDKAMAKSSNVFFVDAGYRLYQVGGLNSLSRWAWKLGLGHDPNEPTHSTTGIEINENLSGNVYNHETKRLLTQRLINFGVVELLSSGIARNRIPFVPLNIGVDNADEEHVAKAKQAIKDAVKEAVDITLEEADVRTGPKLSDFTKTLVPLFQDFIDTLPADRQASLEKASFYANQIAEYIVYDKVNELWSPVNVLSASLGQGDTQVTLLQMANAIATIANGGTRYRTTLVDRVLDQYGEVILETQPEVLEETGIQESTIRTVLDSMESVNTPGGTAYATFKNFPIRTGGKTGTATWKSDQEKYGRAAYGVYVSFAPAEDPEIAIAVILYDATRGSFVAPIALAMYEEYFKERLETEFPNYKRQFNYEFDDPTETLIENYDGNPIQTGDTRTDSPEIPAGTDGDTGTGTGTGTGAGAGTGAGN